MRLNQVVAQALDVIDGQLGDRMRVEHRRMIDMLLLAGCRRFQRQRLGIDIGAVQSGTLRSRSPT